VRHPAAWADATPKAEGVVNGGVNTRVNIGPDEAFRLEGEGIGEKSVVVKDSPDAHYYYYYYYSTSTL
jgi:hypothetical protein